MLTTRHFALALCVSLLGSACLEPADDLEVGTSTAALASDPATAVEGGWCYYKYKWNGTRARVYHPSNGGCSASIYSPLVLIMIGNGFAIEEYHYLGKHLAKNGFIAAVVDPIAQSGNILPPDAGDYQDAADKGWAFVVDFMWTKWSKRFYINPNQVALIGHSRGGEAVRHLADSLAGDAIFDVKAVVGLAGTDHTSEFVGSGDTIAALYLHGSKDGDVDIDRGVRAYDKTGVDTSQNDPAYNSNVLHRTMKLFIGGDHPNFSGKYAGSQMGDKPTQRAAAKGYVLAFLKAHLAGDYQYYADYIRGDAVPGGWALGIYNQTSDGFYNRTVDNFENGWVGINALGDFVLSGGNLDLSIENLGADGLVAHDTRALSVTANKSGSWVQWNLPAGKRNASFFRVISLRIGRRGSVGDGGVSLQIANGGIWSAPQALTDYGEIAEELTTCADDDSPGCLAPAPSIATMSTVRIPLSDLGPHNNVTAVRLTFDGDAIGGELLIDSLALSEWLWAP